MYNINDIVVVKSFEEFENDAKAGLCHIDSDGDIYYNNSEMPFTEMMYRFCNKKFIVDKYLNDDEIFLKTDEDDLESVIMFTFTTNMLKPYIDDTDSLTKEDYLNLISSVNYEYFNLINILNKTSTTEVKDYIMYRIKYLDKLKEKLCDKVSN